MSYDESEVVDELNFRMDDGDLDDEPLEPEDGDGFKFDEEEEDDPEDKFH